MISSAFSPNEIIAAYLSDPLRVPAQALPWLKSDVQQVVQVLQRNKVPLLSIAASEENKYVVDEPAFRTARCDEERLLDGLRVEYMDVKEALASEGVSDVMIKSVGLAPSFPYRSDNLDVLYKPEDVEVVRRVLQSMGYVELKNVEEPLKYLFRKFHSGHSVSAIHLHAQVGWMVSFLDEDALRERCAMSDDDPLVMVPAAEDALLTTLAHYFYEDKRVALLDVIKLTHCLRRGVDWDEVYRVATWRGWRDGLSVSLLLCAYQECALYGASLVPPTILKRALSELPGWTQRLLERRLGDGVLESLGHGAMVEGAEARRDLPLRIPFAFSKFFFYSKLLRDPTRSRRRKLKDLAVHTANGTKLRLRIHSQPRMLVTLSGVDGSGKTTQAKMLQSAFEVCHLRVHSLWSRGGSAPWLQLFTRWARGTAEADCQLERTSEEHSLRKMRARQGRFRSPLARWGWSWLTAIELLLRYTRRVTLPLVMGRVVICDRYIYDAFADWAAYFDERAEQCGAARLLRLLSPRPQIAYWLQIPTHVAQSRSTAWLLESFLDSQTTAYERMAAPYGLCRVEGSRDQEELADELVHQVLGRYFARYRTAINHVFLKNPGQWR